MCGARLPALQAANATGSLHIECSHSLKWGARKTLQHHSIDANLLLSGENSWLDIVPALQWPRKVSDSVPLELIRMHYLLSFVRPMPETTRVQNHTHVASHWLYRTSSKSKPVSVLNQCQQIPPQRTWLICDRPLPGNILLKKSIVSTWRNKAWCTKLSRNVSELLWIRPFNESLAS
jgi:hypothetical protein